jgi:hypothetical protein
VDDPVRYCIKDFARHYNIVTSWSLVKPTVHMFIVQSCSRILLRHVVHTRWWGERLITKQV